jgi:hypothetical protein
MGNFDFKKVIRENLYNQNYPYLDKVKIILNENRFILVDKKIHEGILDWIKNWGKNWNNDSQKGDKREKGVSDLENKIHQYLNLGSLGAEDRETLINYYIKNISELPPAIFSDSEAADGIGDALEKGRKGDFKGAKNSFDDLDANDEGEPKSKRSKKRDGRANRAAAKAAAAERRAAAIIAKRVEDGEGSSYENFEATGLTSAGGGYNFIPGPNESLESINEQRYKMLLKRFNI